MSVLYIIILIAILWIVIGFVTVFVSIIAGHVYKSYSKALLIGSLAGLLTLLAAIIISVKFHYWRKM